jgi:copper chaperone CopZ
MRFLRSLRIALPVLLIAAAAVPAVACTIESAFINGTFDTQGRFVVNSAMDCCGKALQVQSFTCEKLTMEPGVALAASSLSGQTVYAVGNLDPEHRSVHVTRFTTDAAVADAAVAQARTTTQVASAGAGCCAAKGAAAASASSAGAGSACAAKGAAASAAGAGSACAGKAAAASAGAGHCVAKGTAASTAGAGSACAGVAKSAEAKSVAAPAANQVVFAVSGMTCGGCASKVQSAVKSLELTQVTNCEVDVTKATAVLTLAEGQKIDTEAVAKAITAAGFPAQPQAAPAGDAERAPKAEEATSTH